MELDRFCIFLSALVVVFAAETTLDIASTTSATNLSADTDVTQQLTTTTPRSVKKTPPTTDIPLDNEIEVEERATTVPIRTPAQTEETAQVKEVPTTKVDSTTIEAKEVLDNDITTAASPSPVHVTERSSLTTKMKEVTESASQRSTTPPPSQETIVTITPSTVTQRPTKIKQKKNKTRQKPTTTTTTPPTQRTKTEEILQQVPADSIIQEVTARPLSKPTRKSTVEAKKGTINAGGPQKYKRRKPSKKDNGMSSLVYIPLMIQAQMIPMMLMQLKFFALKALAIGKLALIILGLNLLRNAIIGYHNDEQQYEQESLASAHYGYNGGPEYGSWVNRRMFRTDPVFTDHREIPEMELRRNNDNRYAYNKYRLNRSQSRFSNNPYRGQENHMLKKTR